MSVVNNAEIPIITTKNEVEAPGFAQGSLSGHPVTHENPDTLIDEAQKQVLAALMKKVSDIMFSMMGMRMDPGGRKKLLSEAGTSTLEMNETESACRYKFLPRMHIACAEAWVNMCKEHPMLSRLVTPAIHSDIVQAQFTALLPPFAQTVLALNPQYVEEAKKEQHAKEDAEMLLRNLAQGLDTFTEKDLKELEKHAAGDVAQAPIARSSFSSEDNMVKAQALIEVVHESDKAIQFSTRACLQAIVREQLEKIAPQQTKKEETLPKKETLSVKVDPKRPWGGIL